MHTYVLASFVVNAVCAVLILLGFGLTKKVTESQAVALFAGIVWLIWAGVLLFGA